MPEPSDEPRTYFERQRRKMTELGEGEGDAIPQLPPESPWSTQLPDEPLIDRTEDKS
jgi:hypothetical protein